MNIPLIYVVRSLLQRKGSTALTIGSFALVVLVLIALLSMVRGINQTLISSGEPDRMFAIDKEASAENQSRLSYPDALAVGTYGQVRLDERARPLTSYELVGTTYADGPGGERVQVNFRGVDLDEALRVHNQLRLRAGRFFDPDAEGEVIAGKGIVGGLGIPIGGTFSARQNTWRVVGVFSDGGSPSESEIWTSRSNMDLLFDKDYISSVWALVKDPSLTAQLVTQLNQDKTLSVFATTEQDYFAQGAGTARGLQALAWFVAVIMSIGAVFSAMNTMYASVSDRAGELGTLRAIGFTPGSVLRATLLEALILAVAGGVLAGLLALALNGITFRTPVPGIGFVSFAFAVTPGLLAVGVVFSVVMGLVGGWVPARYATRMPIIDALKG